MRVPQLPAFAAGLLLALSSGALVAQATPYERVMAPYQAELDRQCPGRNLQDLTAGDLEFIMEGFQEDLPKVRLHRIARNVGHACARVIAGLGCANTETLLAFEHAGLLRSFTAHVCASPWRCTAPGECTETSR